MLKPDVVKRVKEELDQPPSGGCVLKLRECVFRPLRSLPAAFRRLCVETIQPSDRERNVFPAAFRRLCVETMPFGLMSLGRVTSRLQAAVC